MPAAKHLVRADARPTGRAGTSRAWTAQFVPPKPHGQGKAGGGFVMAGGREANRIELAARSARMAIAAHPLRPPPGLPCSPHTQKRWSAQQTALALLQALAPLVALARQRRRPLQGRAFCRRKFGELFWLKKIW